MDYIDISTNQITSEFCLLLSAVYNVPEAYISLYRGLKYLLEVPYIVQDYRIFDFRDSVFGQVENITMSENNITKLSQFVCLISVHIFVC